MSQPVRVRIAPSPSGNLHVGTARAALFNFMFARRHGGQFILRIEDTDFERSSQEYVQNIYDSLKALGLQWDEGPDIGGPHAPYQQSERLDLYRQWADRLLNEGWAYLCYKTEAELEADREQAAAEKRPYVYQRPHYTPDELSALAADPARKAVTRFAFQDFCKAQGWATLTFQDQIRGDVSFESALIGDFVIVKSDGTPTYNFAVVVDDITMAISHVIRGEDHISNTPKQIALFHALGHTPPVFAHCSMILATDRSKLSKRHGATAVSEYVAQGYLPEAFCNFLALLGWSPPDGQEVSTLSHFIEQFELGRIAHSNAVFDQEKLNWINGQYIRQLTPSVVLDKTRSYFRDAGLDLDALAPAHQLLMVSAVQESLTRLEEVVDHTRFFFGLDVERNPQAVEEFLSSQESTEVLQAFEQDFLPSAPWEDPEAMGEALKAFVKALKPLKPKSILMPIRVALTGQHHGADLSKTLVILGPEIIHHRLNTARDVTLASPSL